MVEEKERLVLSIEEAGRLLGVSRPTAYKMAHAGQIPLIKTGDRKWAVPKAALDKMLLEAGTKDS
jgi:excisionase family DNA binding protein